MNTMTKIFTDVWVWVVITAIWIMITFTTVASIVLIDKVNNRSIDDVTLVGNYLVRVPNGHGNGVALKDVFLTSAHVVNNGGPPDDFVWTIDGIEGSGVISYGESGTDTDYALLDLQFPDYAEVYCGPLKRNQQIFYKGELLIRGNPINLYYSGRILETQVINNVMFDGTILADIPVVSGMSGGPIYNRDGQVIGIMGGILEMGSWSVAFIIPLPKELCE